MATRLHYAVPIARQLLLSAVRRLRPGELSARLPNTARARPFIIVTGPGRSGTSAVARVLHESGLSMGTEFHPPSDYNATGFYEDVHALSVNDQILGELGLSQIGTGTWPWRSTVLAVGGRHAETMQELASRGTDGWKDPRFSLTLEAWLPHLPGPPKIVLCLRSPEAFLHSVARIYGLVGRDEIERLWANELRRLLDVISAYRLEVTCIEYDGLVQRPEETIAALSSFVGHPLDAQYVEPALRHHEYAVPRRYAALYDHVRALGPGGAGLARPKRARWGVALLARLRGSAPPTEEARAIDEYLVRARAIAARTEAAKDAWSERVGRDRLEIDRVRSQPMEETHAASAAYVEVLREAQAELGAQVAPALLERSHDSLRTWVDRERLVAQLMLQATEGEQADDRRLDTALRAWRQFSSPEAFAQGLEQRSREHQRALRRSGRSSEG